MIDPNYLPFTREELRPHFAMDADPNSNKFERSARVYREFLQEGSGLPLPMGRHSMVIRSRAALRLGAGGTSRQIG